MVTLRLERAQIRSERLMGTVVRTSDGVDHTTPNAIFLSPNPPNGVVVVAEREIRDMEERLSGRFWTVGVSGRSAVVVSSRSPRDRTQQKTLTGRSGAGLGPVWREFWETLG